MSNIYINNKTLCLLSKTTAVHLRFRPAEWASTATAGPALGEIERLFPLGSLKPFVSGKRWLPQAPLSPAYDSGGGGSRSSASPAFDSGDGGSRSSESPALGGMDGERRSLQFDGVASGG
ncbi:Uncharacterized protein Rs2_24975 [Raphanus sativus]|nr:Uncharacterized protein Rs2_24975 [Raphanus sativus]